MSNPMKIKTKLQGQDVMCKNECGFYGNPEWQGYCSKCHRELHQKMKPDRASKGSKKVQRSHSDVQETSLNLGFGKFEEKKKQQAEKRSKTLTKIMKRGHTLKETSSQSPSKDVVLIREILHLIEDLNLKETVGKDIAKQIQTQLDLMGKHYDKSIDEQSEMMQDFYNFMFNRCETHPSYQDMSSEQVDQLMDQIEKQLMNHMYRSAFQLISTEYEEKDLALQKRIKSLNWISSQHLFLNITESNPEIRDLIDKAITDVIAVDSEIAPQDKINCIVNCSKSIFRIINLCQGVASADEFLPAMVYIVLQANPPLLQSNIKYVTSYSIPARLRSGEGAYYFTNLCCAVAFIEDLNYESLNMSEDEFQRYMSGEVPLGHVGQNPLDCEGLRLMSQNLNSLTKIQEKNNQVLSDMLTLRNDMIKFEETLQKCKPPAPLIIRQTPYTVPSNTDMSLLPEIFRNRIVFAPVEDILVDLDSKTPEHSPEKLPLTKHTPVVDLSTITSKPNSLASLQPIKLTDENPIGTVASIQDVEYPTELFSDKAEVEFGPFEGCDAMEKVKVVSDPLSPDPELMGESLNLPPPLLPLVVQSGNVDPACKHV